jgi:hypothetical protein
MSGMNKYLLPFLVLIDDDEKKSTPKPEKSVPVSKTPVVYPAWVNTAVVIFIVAVFVFCMWLGS